MNIAIFSDTFTPDINGVATSVNALFKVLNKFGHNCYLVTTNYEKGISFKDNILRIPGIDMKKLYGYRAALPFNQKAFKILKQLELDIVHVNTEFGIGQFGFICARKLKIPAVYTYHTMYEDYSYYMTKGYFDRLSKWAVREFCRGCMETAIEIISPSKKTEIYLRLIGLNKRVNIVPTGFDFSRFKVSRSDPKVLEIKEKYNIHNEDKVLLCLGRIAHEKSFDVIINNFAEYINQKPSNNIKFLFVGDGPAKKELEELVRFKNLERYITFVGKVNLEEVPYYYAASDLFLNASISETQGLTFMEAMATKVIILCKYDNNLANVITNGESGYFFNNNHDFINKLSYILDAKDGDLEKIREKALKSIDIFSEKRFYHNVLEVYNRALRRNW